MAYKYINLEARRSYQRKLYANRKKKKTLPGDRYGMEQRKAYNKAYYEKNKEKRRLEYEKKYKEVEEGGKDEVL